MKKDKGYENYRKNLAIAKRYQIPRFINLSEHPEYHKTTEFSGGHGDYYLHGFVAFPLENGDSLIKRIDGRITAQDENFVTIDGEEYFVNWHDVEYSCTPWDKNLYDCMVEEENESTVREIFFLKTPINLFPA